MSPELQERIIRLQRVGVVTDLPLSIAKLELLTQQVFLNEWDTIEEFEDAWQPIADQVISELERQIAQMRLTQAQVPGQLTLPK